MTKLMRVFKDFPCLWLGGEDVPSPAPLRVSKYLPWAIRVDPQDRDQQISVLRDLTDDWLLVLRQDVLPYSVLPAACPEPVLLQAGLPFAYLGRNTVTDDFEPRHGPEVWPRALLSEQLQASQLLASPEVVVPTSMAQWFCNPDPDTTFLNGFASIRHLQDQLVQPGQHQKICQSSSIGADVKFGDIWIAGACHALLRDAPAQQALASEGAALADPQHARQRALDLTRRCRLETEFNVFALSPAESRILKKVAFQVPESALFENLAAVLDRTGDAGNQSAMLHRKAATWLSGSSRPPSLE